MTLCRPIHRADRVPFERGQDASPVSVAGSRGANWLASILLTVFAAMAPAAIEAGAATNSAAPSRIVDAKRLSWPAGDTRTVFVEANVGSDGRLEQVSLRRPEPSMASAVEATVTAWPFLPRGERDRPVHVFLTNARDWTEAFEFEPWGRFVNPGGGGGYIDDREDRHDRSTLTVIAGGVGCASGLVDGRRFCGR